MPLTLRPAIPADRDALVDGNLRIALETEHLALDRELLARGVDSALADPEKAWYLVAEVDGAIAGQVMVTREWSDWRNGWIWWLQSVYVWPEHRRQGVLTALYRAVQQRAREAGDVKGLRLYVEEENTVAQAAYERLGMVGGRYRVYEADDELAGARAESAG